MLRALALLFTVFLLTVASIHIQQHLVRRRAERLLAEIQSLELRKTSWADARLLFQHWGTNQKFFDPCTPKECSFEIVLDHFAYDAPSWIIRVNDFVHKHLNVFANKDSMCAQAVTYCAYMMVGGRSARVIGTVGMRGSVVWSKGFSIRLWPSGLRYDYMLVGDASSSARLQSSIFNGVDPQLLFHSEYAIGGPGGSNGSLGRVQFTPYTNPEGVRSLMRFNLSCMTRWHQCVDRSDLMPAAWSQHLAELPSIETMWTQQTCSPQVIELLGREAPIIATGKVLAYRKESTSDGYIYGVATVRILKKLKSVMTPELGATRETKVFEDSEDFKRTNLSNHVTPGASYIFLFDLEDNDQKIVLAEKCSILPLNDSNLMRLTTGIARDYTAKPNI